MGKAMSLFDYVKPDFPENCKFNISPSCIGKFFQYPSVWYEEQYLGKEGMLPTTATITGTICHYIYECVTNKVEVTREEINKELDEYVASHNLKEVDVAKVKNDYPMVTAAVVNEYLLNANLGNKLVKSEIPVVTEIKNGIYVGGTCDRIEGDCVVDFKTVATKPSETEIPFPYKIQLLAYAKILRALRYEVNRIRLVYGVKPTKTLGARCFVVTEEIGFESEKLIDETLELMADTMLTVMDKPELAYLLFKSMKLKEGYNAS